VALLLVPHSIPVAEDTPVVEGTLVAEDTPVGVGTLVAEDTPVGVDTLEVTPAVLQIHKVVAHAAHHVLDALALVVAQAVAVPDDALALVAAQVVAVPQAVPDMEAPDCSSFFPFFKR